MAVARRVPAGRTSITVTSFDHEWAVIKDSGGDQSPEWRFDTNQAPVAAVLTGVRVPQEDSYVTRSLSGLRTVGAMISEPISQLQRSLGGLLRARVAGDDANERARVIWDSDGERWFSPQDPIWRVHADAAMFSGGVAALLLQMLHPLAMAGVAGHSGYRGDPWGRLQRTSHYLASTTFGTVDHALKTIEHVRQIHARVRGKDAFGRPYRADDPHLLMWIHISEVASFLRAYQAYAETPLSAEEADIYVRQAGISAAHLGVIDPPGCVAELEALLASFRPELEATPAARDAAQFLLVEPPLPVAARPGYWAIAAGGIALLDPWARRELSLPRSTMLARGVLSPLGQVSTRTVRWAMAGVAREAA